MWLAWQHKFQLRHAHYSGATGMAQPGVVSKWGHEESHDGWMMPMRSPAREVWPGFRTKMWGEVHQSWPYLSHKSWHEVDQTCQVSANSGADVTEFCLTAAAFGAKSAELLARRQPDLLGLDRIWSKFDVLARVRGKMTKLRSSPVRFAPNLDGSRQIGPKSSQNLLISSRSDENRADGSGLLDSSEGQPNLAEIGSCCQIGWVF